MCEIGVSVFPLSPPPGRGGLCVGATTLKSGASYLSLSSGWVGLCPLTIQVGQVFTRPLQIYFSV